jgi:hypothetical protein
MFARFEKQFTAELLGQMAANGCSLVSWGLESGNAEILRVIEKSISLPHAESILVAAAESGIHNRVLVMYGHPTESFSQAMETVDFLKRNLASIHSISYNYYHPEMGTPIESLAARQGIELERDDARDLTFGYRWESRLSEEQKVTIKGFFEGFSHELAVRQVGIEAGAGVVPSPRDLFDDENSFTISFPTKDGRTTLLSSLVNRAGGKQRESFIVTEI